jgi:nucleotide-binding universal stress UspA family protein
MSSVSRVVVGVDGSPLSQTAVARAARFASDRGMTLHVLHAFATDLPMLGFGAVSDREVILSHGKRLVAEAAARAHAIDPDLTVTTSLRDGYASEALVAVSKRAELLAIGAMGNGVFSRASVGAVAMQVVTHARCPVLVVQHELSGRPETGGRVVVGVDGSPESLRALRVGFREAALTGGPLDVVHAWQAKSAQDPTLGPSSDWEDYVARVGSVIDAELAEARAAQPDVKVEQEVLRADPLRSLVDRSEGASLVVVGSRGSGGFPGLHVGSTALRLMGRSNCPILFTR